MELTDSMYIHTHTLWWKNNKIKTREKKKKHTHTNIAHEKEISVWAILILFYFLSAPRASLSWVLSVVMRQWERLSTYHIIIHPHAATETYTFAHSCIHSQTRHEFNIHHQISEISFDFPGYILLYFDIGENVCICGYLCVCICACVYAYEWLCVYIINDIYQNWNCMCLDLCC